MDINTGSLEVEESLDDFMTMYAAGNATTSTTLLWSLGQLTRNPGVLEKVVEEVSTNCGFIGSIMFLLGAFHNFIFLWSMEHFKRQLR